ncbi:MAG: 50S ribosomal protein L13 [Candidatus Thermoplasmatota archaeon]|nr:50S ribosomal protein L13 [Candidatus Thermoplasmatota archaeon]
MKVVDATGAPLGRLASHLAEHLLDGEQITVINAEQAIIVGNRDEIQQRYKHKRERGGTKRKGPHFPRMPDKILKRTVRGMLPYQKARGRQALKNLKAHIGTPDGLGDSEAESLTDSTTSPHITLKDLSTFLGISW